MVSSLSRWLKKAPQPHSVRYTTDDDDERSLAISGNANSRWKAAADDLESLKARRVECLDKDGNVLRVTLLGTDPEMGDKAERESKASARENASLSLVLDAQGRRISEAYMAGAEAASRGQDNLVQVVNILTTQWSATMQSLHNVSMNLAKLARTAGQGDGEEEDTVGPAIQQMLGIAAMKMMGGMGGAEHAEANGKTKKEK